MCWFLGWRELPARADADRVARRAFGVWLFYVQHQFEDVYWENSERWSYDDAALRGSSYLKLPKVLQFFTGNIGLHHVHHLSTADPQLQPPARPRRLPGLLPGSDALGLGRDQMREAEALG